MNSKDNEFMTAIVGNMIRRKENMQKDVVLSRRCFLQGIKLFYGLRRGKTVATHAKHLVEEGMFENFDGGYRLTEKAKRLFGATHQVGL